MVCPSEIASLMERCLDADVEHRPAFREIVEILAKVYMIIMILLHIVHGCICREMQVAQLEEYLDIFKDRI